MYELGIRVVDDMEQVKMPTRPAGMPREEEEAIE
jgi:hypothetical protein